MEDVTGQILGNISPIIAEDYRNYYINNNIDGLIASETKKTGNTIVIKPFFEGNQYFLFEYEVFTDVRLVGAPPSEIGKFGGDTDNWVWPRHTGDFSIFRVYAGKDNKPAPYSSENVPYKPRKVVPISLKGTEKDDFTLVYGYPGYTNTNLYSAEVSFIINILYPNRINLRTIRLQAMEDEMKKDPKVKIQYATKYYGTSNSWKKWQGEVRGLTRADAVEIIKKKENELEIFLKKDSVLGKRYKGLFSAFDSIYPIYNKYTLVNDYSDESIMAIELMNMAGRFFNTCIAKKANDTISLEDKLKQFKVLALSLLKNYNKILDKKIFAGLMQQYVRNIPEEYHPAILKEKVQKFNGNFTEWAEEIYSNSVFCDSIKLKNTINNPTPKKINKLINDPAVKLYTDFGFLFSTKVKPEYYYYGSLLDSLYRQYLSLLLEYKSGTSFYPDANHTLRIAFGKAEGYHPADAVTYDYYTTTAGILEKCNPNVDDYNLSAKVKELYQNRDFGRYADKNGNLRVCFSASNHTSGGNSGSPVFNAYGQLIGLNFDRCWEGTMSDILFDPKLCRNITLDIRYLLFIVDKYAGADNLLQEMEIVN